MILNGFSQFPHGPPLALFTVGKTQRTWENGGREMKIRTAERVERFKFGALAFALAILACISAMASDVERQIPVLRDTAGSGLTNAVSPAGAPPAPAPFPPLD